MEVDDAALVDGAVELVEIIGEDHAVVRDDVGCATDARRCIVAVLSHLISCACDDEAGSGRDIERVLAVATCSYHVDVTVAVEGHGDTRRKDTIAEPQELIDSNATHLDSRQQRSNLCIVELTLCDSNEQLFGFLTGKFLVIEELIENFLDVHISMSLCNYYFTFVLRNNRLKAKRPVVIHGRPLLFSSCISEVSTRLSSSRLF